MVSHLQDCNRPCDIIYLESGMLRIWTKWLAVLRIRMDDSSLIRISSTGASYNPAQAPNALIVSLYVNAIIIVTGKGHSGVSPFFSAVSLPAFSFSFAFSSSSSCFLLASSSSAFRFCLSRRLWASLSFSYKKTHIRNTLRIIRVRWYHWLMRLGTCRACSCKRMD